MVGQAFDKAATMRGSTVIGAARHTANHICDVRDVASVKQIIEQTVPDCVVNAAAVVSFDECEKDPATSYAINARAVSFISEACAERSIKFVQISTDQYFTADGDQPHDEAAPVILLNEYARSKFAGETFALENPSALVVRTNVTGLRGWKGRPTFFESIVDVLMRRSRMTLFDDYFGSTIDTMAFSNALIDLIEREASGILNVASRQVASKKEFILAVAAAMNIEMNWAQTGSVRELPVRRAESAGLDVGRAERILGRRLPDLREVVLSLVSEWRLRNAI
jgi:dTDP-4-dehydrorhamnose reductase